MSAELSVIEAAFHSVSTVLQELLIWFTAHFPPNITRYPKSKDDDHNYYNKYTKEGLGSYAIVL